MVAGWQKSSECEYLNGKPVEMQGRKALEPDIYPLQRYEWSSGCNHTLYMIVAFFIG